MQIVTIHDINEFKEFVDPYSDPVLHLRPLAKMPVYLKQVVKWEI